MWLDKDVLRIGYLPSILIPLLVAIIFGNGSFLGMFGVIIGWSFLAIGQNLLNDFFDQDRKIIFEKSGTLGLFLLITLFGFLLLKNFILYGAGFVILVSIYNWKLKKIFLFESVLLSFAYVVIPFLSISTNYNVLLLFFIYGVTLNVIERIIDGYYKKYEIKLIRIVQILYLISSVYGCYLILENAANLFILIPFIVISILMVPTIEVYHDLKSKIWGVYLYNFLVLYLIGVLVEIGKFI